MQTYTQKWPLWYWIIIYLVIATILYGIVYLIFITRLPARQVRQDSQNQNIQQNPYINTIQKPINSVEVAITATGFSPSKLTIKKGQTVVWTNTDTAKHTVTATDKNGPHSPELGRGSSYTDTFITTGTFNYHCTLHPTMKGTITVVE